MSYEYEFRSFPIDERAAAAALGIDYAELLATRKLASEEREGLHGSERREIREAMDAIDREMQRSMLGL